MANDIGWGEGVINIIGWGADGQINGQEVTNIVTEFFDFLMTENGYFLVEETTINTGGFGSVYDYSWSGETLLER